jgi:hypothetical protein
LIKLFLIIYLLIRNITRVLPDTCNSGHLFLLSCHERSSDERFYHGLHHLLVLLCISNMIENQKSRVPRHQKIFRQPGCLCEILKAFRPTLADG